MATTPRKCPSCGAMSGGKFCAECGAPLGPAACRSCGAPLSSRARFCAECGTPVASAAPARAPLMKNAGDRMAWYVAGIAVLALIVVVVVLVARRSPPPATADAAATGAAAGAMPGAVRATTDLSTMTPRQAADMLFNKIMTLHEAGQNDSVTFFAPMALQAYANLGPDLDADARLHVGLIELAIGAPAAAAAQGDSILRREPTHLFGFLLKADAAEAQNNAAAGRRAYQGFLKNYDAEMAKQRPEYAEHAQILQDARTKAERALGTTGGGS